MTVPKRDMPGNASTQRSGQVEHRILQGHFLWDCSYRGRKLLRCLKGTAQPYVAWDRGTNWHAPVPARPYLSCFSASLALVDAPVPLAAAAAADHARGCVTHMSSTTGLPGRYRKRSPRFGSRWEHSGSCVVPVALSECAAAAAQGVCGEWVGGCSCDKHCGDRSCNGCNGGGSGSCGVWCCSHVRCTGVHTFLVQWSEDVKKADPFFGRSRVRFRVPPWVLNTIARDHLA